MVWDVPRRRLSDEEIHANIERMAAKNREEWAFVFFVAGKVWWLVRWPVIFGTGILIGSGLLLGWLQQAVCR